MIPSHNRMSKEEQLMTGRIMSRLYAAPFRMKLRVMAGIWDTSIENVGRLIRQVRGY